MPRTKAWHHCVRCRRTFSFDVSGVYAASDPDTLDSDSLLGRVVALSVAQLSRN
jgi:hypothetical protein